MQSIYIFGGIPLVVTALLSSLLTAGVCAASTSIGFLAASSEDTYHDTPRPLGGGVSIFLSILCTVGGGLLFVIYVLPEIGDPFRETLAPHRSGILENLDTLGYLGAGATVMFLVGLWDDRYHLSPTIKLAFELLAALIVVSGGVRFSLFLESDGLLASGIQWIVSLAWVVGVTNSFNLLDNMDGQCAGIAGVLSLVLGVLGFQTGQFFLGTLLFTITGALIGFLVYNFPPARIFAGDSGSLMIGYLLAVAAMLFTFMRPGNNSQVYLSPLILFAVPFYDTSSVLWIRFREGRPLFDPDTSHFSHRLVERGLSERKALFVTILLSVLTGLFTLVMYQATETGANLLFLATIVLLCVLSLLEEPSHDPGERPRDDERG